jgi:hypothetical protein
VPKTDQQDSQVSPSSTIEPSPRVSTSPALKPSPRVNTSPTIKPRPMASTSPAVTSQPTAAVTSSDATLVAGDTNSQINLRATPSSTGRRLGYGLVGDQVQVIDRMTSEGYDWFQVKFPRSGAVGWIRGDFVNVVSASQPSQPSSEPETYSNSSDVTYPSTATTSSGGNCNSPDDLDSRGHRCGGRAASVRSGGRRRRH